MYTYYDTTNIEMFQVLRLQSSPPQAPIFRGNSLLTLKSQRAHGFHPWAYITGTELKMHQNAVFRICNFKILPGMTPQTLVAWGATPSRTLPQHGAGLRRRCYDPHVTPVLVAYILRASSVSETFRRPWSFFSTSEIWEFILCYLTL